MDTEALTNGGGISMGLLARYDELLDRLIATMATGWSRAPSSARSAAVRCVPAPMLIC